MKTIIFFPYLIISAALFFTSLNAHSRPKNKNIYLKKYTFVEDWFTSRLDNFHDILGKYKNKKNIKAIEIGTWEGRSALWLLEQILSGENSHLTIIDPFPNSKILSKVNRAKINFLKNLKLYNNDKKWTFIDKTSELGLRTLPTNSFDFIYVDGSHMARDVLIDAVLSWGLLKVGGILIFDDYDYNFQFTPETRPSVAIEAFVQAFRPEMKIQILNSGPSQIIITKLKKACYKCTRLTENVFYIQESNAITANGKEIKLNGKSLKAINFWVQVRTKFETTINWQKYPGDNFRHLKKQIEKLK